MAAVLEIGCGLGTAALWLARQGHHVVACDIAPGAVRVARERARRAGLAIELRVADVLADTTSLPLADIVLDRGVLHTFVAQEGRVAFAAAVARLLQPGGLWLDVSGSAETPGDSAEAGRSPQHTPHLAQRLLAIRHVVQHLRAEDTIDAGCREWKRLRIGLNEHRCGF